MIKRVKKITEETFSDAVDYAYALDKKLHFNSLSQKIILPLGSILLALHSMILFLGMIYLSVCDNPKRLVAFDAFPFIAKHWNNVWGTIGSISDIVYVKIILTIVFSLMVPFVLCSIAALVVFCVTKSKNPTIEGSTTKSAKKLYNYVKNIPQTYGSMIGDKPAIWRRICGIVSGVGIIVFAFYYYGCFINQDKNFLAAFSALFQSDKHSEDILICIVFGILFYVAYAVLHIVLYFMIRPYCNSYKEWETFADEAEQYWLSVDKDERKKREEDASREHYDGWKYKSLETTEYYKDKKEEYYAQYMGFPYETDEDKAKRLVRDVEEDLSGGGWGDY